MTQIWYLSYNMLVIPALVLFFRIASIFNPKISRGIKDRKKLFENLIINLSGLNRSKKMIWFHSASMGEFEQAKPIIKKIKQERDVNVIITFFSPSGYRNSLQYPYADVISYIPLDSYKLADRFINLIRPNLVVFMRYDIWPNVIWNLAKKKIPSYIVDATMLSNSRRKLPIVKSFHKFLYKNLTKILTVSEADATNFLQFDLLNEQVSPVGDTRFDRVHQKSLQAKVRKLFDENILNGKKVFVFGSSWEADEDVILPAFLKLKKYDSDVVMIIAPHEPTEIHLEKLENYFSKSLSTIRFSYHNNYNGEDVIIVDSIGILLTLYYYADLAYVGGSFKQGIHNVLEPAVYGIPIFFGPKIENSLEAKELVKRGGAKVIENNRQAYRFLRSVFSSSILRTKMGQICDAYVNENIGATEKICAELNMHLE